VSPITISGAPDVIERFEKVEKVPIKDFDSLEQLNGTNICLESLLKTLQHW